MRMLLTVSFLLSCFLSVLAQDEIQYKEKKNGYYQDSILTSIQYFEAQQKKEGSNRYLSLDFSAFDYATDPKLYKTLWHNDPLSQGATGTCWCFATISFLESEIYRMTGESVKLSEMYIVYWEYVARSRYFVQQRGDMYFGQGSESNAVTRIMKEHGLVPANQYTGLLKGQQFHNHEQLAKDIESYFQFIKKNQIWDEESVVSNVKSILDYYLVKPPEIVTTKDNKITPVDYMQEILHINPDDYFCFMSTKSSPYNQKGELTEPDNWWHSKDYYNIHLTDFAGLFQSALDKGYSVSICGDVSEPGYDRYAEVGIIPSFDIPAEFINENSREYRIYNGSTTDDHCIHIIGYTKQEGALWYLIKDSSSGGFDGPHKGYRFIREDYIKLKVLALMIHKNAATEILDKIIK